MAEKRKRSQNFTVDEKDKLVKLVSAYKNIILNKRTDGTTNQESQTIILDAELVTDTSINKVKEHEDTVTNTPSCSNILTTPLWKRRRPILKEQNHPQSEVVATLCTGFHGINNKKIEIEDLKKKLLEEEIEFKRSLHNLQLESARKDLEIKIEVFNQIRGGNFNMGNLFGVPKSDQK